MHRKPVYRFSEYGYQPWGAMLDLWASHDSGIKVAGGTYDAGKTYGGVGYIDMLAMKYPGCENDVCASESQPCVS